jgi:hypothetical protein
MKRDNLVKMRHSPCRMAVEVLAPCDEGIASMRPLHFRSGLYTPDFYRLTLHEA